MSTAASAASQTTGIDSSYLGRCPGRLLDEHHLEGYTELDEVRGAGTTGKRLRTRAYPGSSCMVFVVVESSKVDGLLAALEEFCGRCAGAERVRVLVLPVERTI